MSEVCLEYKEKAEGAVATNIGKTCPILEMPTSPSTETAALVASLVRAEIHLGVDGGLSLSIRSYVPTVSCRGPLLLYHSEHMDQILHRMPAASSRIAFGRRGVPGVRVVVPLRYNAGK